MRALRIGAAALAPVVGVVATSDTRAARPARTHAGPAAGPASELPLPERLVALARVELQRGVPKKVREPLGFARLRDAPLDPSAPDPGGIRPDGS